MAQKIVTGDKALDKALEKLPLAMQKKPIRKGTRKVAKAVLVLAKQGAPIDSGELEDTLKVRAAKFPRRSGKFGHTIIAGEASDEPYWVFVEFGTVDRTTGTGAGRGSVEADPFLRPALYDSAPIAKPTIAAEIRTFLAGNAK